MSGLQDHDALAAEYVLGCLEGDEARAAERLLSEDPAFVRMVEAWQQRLIPLARLLPATAPPADLWERIDASTSPAITSPAITSPGRPASAAPTAAPPPTLAPDVPAPNRASSSDPAAHDPSSHHPPSNDNLVPLRRVRFWQAATVGALAIAASLAAFMLIRPPEPTRVAVLTPMAGAQPVLLATVEPAGALTIRPSGRITVPSDQDLELWALARGETRPRSLGVLPAEGKRLTASLAPDTQLLVSLEPRGGSPTGLPTGPVLYGGTLTGLN